MNEFTPKAYRKEVVDPEEPARAELQGTERLIWAGQPIAKRTMLVGFIVYPFALLWTGFSVFWVVMAFMATRGEESTMALLFPLFGVPFILIGVGMLASPFLAYNKAKKTIYAITNKRAFIKKNKVESYPFSDWEGEITSTERVDKTGSLFFARRLERNSKGRRIMRRKGFEHIENVGRVEEKLRRAFREYQARQSL